MGIATAAPAVDEDVPEDGRRLRRERNRVATVDAMLELIHAGNLAPSTEQIAERAGLSPRSLFRYFDDLDDLQRAAISRHLERVRPTLELDIDPTTPIAVRVGQLVDQRLRMFDVIGAVGHVTRMRAPFQPLLAEQLTQLRSFLRHQIERLFAPELATSGRAAAASALAAADVITSFEAYHLLRDDQKLSRTRAASVMRDALVRLLDP